MARRGTGLLDHFKITVAPGEKIVYHRGTGKLDRYECDVRRNRRVIGVAVGRNAIEARRHAWVIAYAFADELERQRNMAAKRRARV